MPPQPPIESPTGAPPAAIGSVPTPPKSTPAAPQRTSGAPQPSPETTEAPKPKSARERLFEDLRKIGKPTNASENEPEKPAARTSEEPPSGETQTPEGKTPEPAKKPNPWRLVDDYKARVSALERDLVEARKGGGFEDERKQLSEKLSTVEKRYKELDDHIRYIDFTKSEEFRTKYQEPYENAWKRALSDLAELTVTNQSTGEERPLSPDDILALVNMPLTKARETALNVFGDFADDVMTHRKEIRKLFDEQNAALAHARAHAAEHSRKMEEDQKKMVEQLTTQASHLWDKHTRGTLADPKYGKYFSPVEGDEQGNQRLAKGFDLVDRAFRENPMDPRLTPEVRESIVRRHVAVRNRAAAFGKLVFMLSEAEARIATLEKSLGQYKGSEPGNGDGKGASSSTTPAASSVRDEVFGALRKLGKPV